MVNGTSYHVWLSIFDTIGECKSSIASYVRAIVVDVDVSFRYTFFQRSLMSPQIFTIVLLGETRSSVAIFSQGTDSFPTSD